MNINNFAKFIAWKESGKKEISIAQIKEVLKVTKDLLKSKTGINLYKLIRDIKDD